MNFSTLSIRATVVLLAAATFWAAVVFFGAATNGPSVNVAVRCDSEVAATPPIRPHISPPDPGAEVQMWPAVLSGSGDAESGDARSTHYSAASAADPAAQLKLVLPPLTTSCLVGRSVRIDVVGLSEQQAKQAVLLAWPSTSQAIAAKTWGGKPFIIFTAFETGDYLIAVSAPADAGVAQATVTLPVIDRQPPDPPTPDPAPAPGPEPTPQKSEAVFFFESNDLDNMDRAQVAIVRGRAFRDRLAEAGHRFIGSYDFDAVVTERTYSPPGSRQTKTVREVKPNLWPFWKAAYDAGGSDVLPLVVFRPLSGGEPVARALPATEADTLFLLSREVE